MRRQRNPNAKNRPEGIADHKEWIRCRHVHRKFNCKFNDVTRMIRFPMKGTATISLDVTHDTNVCSKTSEIASEPCGRLRKCPGSLVNFGGKKVNSSEVRSPLNSVVKLKNGEKMSSNMHTTIFSVFGQSEILYGAEVMAGNISNVCTAQCWFLNTNVLEKHFLSEYWKLSNLWKFNA